MWYDRWSHRGSSASKYAPTSGASDSGSLTCWNPSVVARTIALGASSEPTRRSHAARFAAAVGTVARARAADC